MAYLFLDIESFVDPEDTRSGLNPFHKNSKVIVISYAYYASPFPPSPAEVKKPCFMFIWNFESEKQLLKEFYINLKKLSEGQEYFKIIGFNQLAYDLPFLFSRMAKHKIAPEKELFDLLFSKVRHIDLAQISMAVSKFTKRDQDFRNISQKAINLAYDIPIKEDNGVDVTRYYLEKRYDKIEKYCAEEFTFELLYQSLLETFLH
jgi:DNA polymerase elongation subunit (family B)